MGCNLFAAMHFANRKLRSKGRRVLARRPEPGFPDATAAYSCATPLPVLLIPLLARQSRTKMPLQFLLAHGNRQGRKHDRNRDQDDQRDRRRPLSAPPYERGIEGCQQQTQQDDPTTTLCMTIRHDRSFVRARRIIAARMLSGRLVGGIAPVYKPFAGQQIGPFTVLSPTPWVYQRLVPQFRKTPAPDIDRLKAENMWIGERAQPSIFASLIRKATSWIPEIWEFELLREGAITAAENESSTVLLGQFGTTSILLTADAGVNGLTWACNYAQLNGIDLSNLQLVQVPHHGSRSNVTPSVLDRLLGPRLPRGAAQKRFAVVSAPKDDENHRRGAPVSKTQGIYFRYHSGTMPHRPSEGHATPFSFFDQVENYD
jgi:hypothetical protein